MKLKQFGTEQAMISPCEMLSDDLKCLYMYTLHYNNSSRKQSYVGIKLWSKSILCK